MSKGKRIKGGYLLPSAAFTVPKKRIQSYVSNLDKKPEVGDLVYGSVEYLGQHTSLENRQGRIHTIYDGSKAVFVLGNRYAPDYYEGFVPNKLPETIDLLARSGVIGSAKYKNAKIKDPTKIKVLGYVCDKDGRFVNTRQFNQIIPKKTVKTDKRAKMILVVGTCMNSGKSYAAAACCWILNNLGYKVRGAKITGTASLKDILLLEDNGASAIADFTYLGYPSTYMLKETELLHIFNSLDLKFANHPGNYWVVEIADGIIQRETSLLLKHEDIRSRIHKLIFCAQDTFGAIGGLKILRDEFALTPDAISGVCSSSPLGIRELQEYTDLPIFNSVERNLKQLSTILV
ncbi:MAG: hypothetical protein JXA52_06465 [Planctomycetes bacterium]|nr:hypothetical protein [Planctomycetota bacterium]